MNTQEREGAGAGTPSLLNRRTIALGAVWSVPVILAATAAPAAAASNPSAVVATGTLVHATGKNYALTMTYTFTGPPGSTATVSVTEIQAKADSGVLEYFTPPPAAHSLSLGTTQVPAASVERSGNNSGSTATLYYSYTVVVNGHPSTTTASVVVPISNH